MDSEISEENPSLFGRYFSRALSTIFFLSQDILQATSSGFPPSFPSNGLRFNEPSSLRRILTFLSASSSLSAQRRKVWFPLQMLFNDFFEGHYFLLPSFSQFLPAFPRPFSNFFSAISLLL